MIFTAKIRDEELYKKLECYAMDSADRWNLCGSSWLSVWRTAVCYFRGVFALMPLLNIGCNSTRSCNMTSHRNFKKKKAPFEEID